MKHFYYIIAIISLLATLNSCTADEIETDKPKAQAEVQADVDPNNSGSIIPPKK
ncbi:hypothetical protein CLU83_1341 [Flavobacterium sp. 1]|jgi:hypothetical protein|uniref:hypothetical protein n=1 Tax=Flavobacterium sp. 1 TaxID=2035200 RepID=UPI000CB8F468|nr:hypothetical protein [Flavobacterium sp. 1]PJJ08104.1 hypothetical protein CLU83_1341 [Flavobacterium sp. 1]